MQLKILSWNIWVTGDFEQIKELLRSSSADIFALQEVQNDKPELDVINHLKKLGYNYVFAPIEAAWDNQTWHYGPAIFSRFEFVKTRVHSLSKQNKRFAVQADIKVGDKVLHVFSTHLMHTHQQQSEKKYYCDG